MRVLVILLDLVSISETQEPAIINDIARDSNFRFTSSSHLLLESVRILIGQNSY